MRKFRVEFLQQASKKPSKLLPSSRPRPSPCRSKLWGTRIGSLRSASSRGRSPWAPSSKGRRTSSPPRRPCSCPIRTWTSSWWRWACSRCWETRRSDPSSCSWWSAASTMSTTSLSSSPPWRRRRRTRPRSRWTTSCPTSPGCRRPRRRPRPRPRTRWGSCSSCSATSGRRAVFARVAGAFDTGGWSWRPVSSSSRAPSSWPRAPSPPM